MAASLLLNLGARAMNASQSAINVIGHNIANVNTPGYSRQTAVLTTATPQFTGAGFQGKGVMVDTINRVYNRFLTQEAQVSRSTASGDETRMLNMQRLDKLFPPGDEGLGAAMGSLLNAMVDVTSRPSDPAARQVVLGRAQEVAARFSNAGQQLSELQAGVVSDLKASLQVVNQLATQIANANQQIARISGGDHAANDLLDQRDQLVYELSKYLTVSTLSADDGSLSVFIGGGQLLVLGNQAQQLALTPDPYDALRVQVSLVQAGGTRALDENVLQGGSVAALVHFQNEDLQDARNYVGQLATALAMRVNTQQSLGLNLGTPPVAGEDLFRIGAAKVMPASTNAKDITGNFVAGVQITRVDPDFLQASAYTLKQDASAPGTYLLTRESDGLVRTVADGDIVDGFQITFTPAAPGLLDTYRLEPVATAAIDMRRAFDNPAGIAAASPISGALRVSNTGTATLDRIYAVDPATFTTTNLPATVQFTTVNGDGSVDYVLNGPFGTLNGTWRAGQPIGNETGIALGFELHLNGVPRANDWIDLSVTQFVGQNNGNAKAFLALQTEAFVGKQLDPLTSQISAGATLNDAYSAAMGEIGARVQGSVYLAEMSDKVAQEADTARAAEAGVNLDEEAARLLQYQQAYQAAAKVMQVAQIVFDELIRTVGS
ncbi:flagellar hook-associated protein FlgK [Inhella gelatinilytica]|uniref:Flagellar hook-associated protein 1 n=1 Tax=Inhella gelatinilytica TaxID=2795030 RepID=A0A931NBG1_9BURK|nr:flagellar hook-associated protein FlgK [Inhella gelatinilytica]MBH9553548.1 flagellar hook-associated protein FlgK [Inhella gelatinilytica]